MRHRSGARLFIVYAGTSLLAVIALGVVLDRAVTAEVDEQALSSAVARAQTIARASIEPALVGSDLRSGLGADQRIQVARVATALLDDHSVLRLRIRSPGGAIAFDPERPTAPPRLVEDDEVVEAASGEPVRVLTRVGSDAVDGSSHTGTEAVETYVAIHEPGTGRVVGVLETYLPYAPFREAALHTRRRISGLLAIGLLGLWLVLALISWSVTRRLRRSAQSNDWLARHDPLTGLPNRVGFAEELAHREGTALTVSMVDIDRFREINDTLGHRNADDFLRAVSDAIVRVVPDGAVVARLGGDQFGVVSAGDDPGPLAAMHARIAGAASPTVPIAGIRVGAEVTIGFASSSGSDGVDGTLRAAELALHAAKETGTSPLAFDPVLDHFDPERLALAGELGRAISHGELVLHYQPKLDLGTGGVQSVEALVRWVHPRRGMVPPGEFVPIAESTSLMRPLTQWVLAEAVGQLSGWLAAGQDLSVSVNVSARSLVDQEFPAELMAVLSRHRVPPERLVLEITETAIVADPIRAASLLGRLHDAGVRISLDDFGQGATSLASLAGLPLDEIKVDRAFVVGMDRSEQQRAVVEFVISLGHRLGLLVVAEGIETEAAAADLVAMGCDEGQGFLYSRPVPGPDLLDWIDHHHRLLAARAAAVGSPADRMADVAEFVASPSSEPT